jgi:hypothetical protein
MNKKLLMLGVLVLAAVMVLWSCNNDINGVMKPNQRPSIGITNIDYYDSLFTFNAVIDWYGIDPDGQVVSYYYIVKLSTEVGDSSEAYSYMEDVLSQSSIEEWTQTEETAATIQMLASPNETDTLYQYVFFTCQDDEGAFSDTLFYALYRVNRLPQTYIGLLPGNFNKQTSDTTTYTLPVWSLPDTNSLWSGLTLTWSSGDTLDFPDGAPDFEYRWEIYGPYDTTHFSYTDSLIDLTYDDITDDSLYVQSCSDAEAGYVFGTDVDNCDNIWVWDKTITFTGLPTGCYIMVVTARDDALVPDDSPAWGKFVVIEPDWISKPDQVRDIIVVQATQFNTGTTRGWPSDSIMVDSTLEYFPSLLMEFYSGMIEGAGEYTYDIYGDPAMGRNTDAQFPTMYDLAHYRMVLIDDLDYLKNELASVDDDEFVPFLMDYLSVGGQAWVIGRQSFLLGNGQFDGFADFAANSLAYSYFDLSAAIYATMDFAGDSAEFIGATAVVSDFGFSDLPIDPVKTGYLDQYGINKVEVFERNSVNSHTLFTYNAANPDTMVEFQYRPCAVVYQPNNQVYKTSYFSFPLYLMDNSEGQVQTVFDVMLSWFLDEN